MPKKLEEIRDEAAQNAPKKDAPEPADESSDLRALLLILVLTVIVFFILLYKQKHPEEYAKSVVQAKENADAAYAKVEEALPEAYRGVGGFFEYVFDYGKAPEMPPEIPKTVILPDSVATGAELSESWSVAPVMVSGSGVASGSGSADDFRSLSGASVPSPESLTAAPFIVESSGYRIEFDRPPTEEVILTVWGSKMTVGGISPQVEK